MKKAFVGVGNVLYTGLVISVLAFALLFVGTKVEFFGYEVKVVQSGSMEPAIETGSIVVIAPASSYAVGDIITFGRDTRNSIPVTHRIIEKSGSGANTSFVTKGDANEEADSVAVAAGSVIGKVALTIPYVGHVIEFARTPWGFLLLIGLPALIIILDEIANIAWEIHKYRYKLRRQGKVGYRQPSRERRPRDFAQKLPKQPQPSKPPRQQKHPEPGVLDLRHYRLNRRGT